MKLHFLFSLACFARQFNYNNPSDYVNVKVVVNGRTYNYIDQGRPEAQVVMILHGFPESWFLFRHQIKALVETGYRVIGLDMLGYGKSESPFSPDAYTYASITDDIKSLLTDHVGVESAVFLAHDWGSMFMWHLAISHPGIIDGLISLCIPIYQPTGFTLEWLATKVDKVRYQLSIGNSNTEKLDSDIRSFLETFYPEDPECLRKLSTAPPEGDIVDFFATVNCDRTLAIGSEEMDFLVEQFSRSGTKGPTNYYRTYNANRPTVIATQGKINIVKPTLYIKAEKDFVLDLGTGANHLFLRDVTEKSIDGGHWIFLTHKEKVNTFITEWMLEKFPIPEPIPSVIVFKK